MKDRYLVLVEFNPEKRDQLKNAAAAAAGKGMEGIIALLPPDLAKASRAHQEYLKRLTEEGRYFAGGPAIVVDGKPIDGINLFEAESEAEVRKLVVEDPFQTEGIFGTVHIYRWNVIAGNGFFR